VSALWNCGACPQRSFREGDIWQELRQLLSDKLEPANIAAEVARAADGQQADANLIAGKREQLERLTAAYLLPASRLSPEEYAERSGAIRAELEELASRASVSLPPGVPVPRTKRDVDRLLSPRDPSRLHRYLTYCIDRLVVRDGELVEVHWRG